MKFEIKNAKQIEISFSFITLICSKRDVFKLNTLNSNSDAKIASRGEELKN